jgi:toxin CptA
MTSAPAIGFEYRPSVVLARLRGIVAALSLLAIALCGLAIWGKLLLAGIVVVSFVRSARRPGQPRIVAAGLGQDGGWSLRYAGGTDAAATLASFRVFGAFVLLHLTTAGRRETLLLGPDNSDADIRRRLRMRLLAARDPVSEADR